MPSIANDNPVIRSGAYDGADITVYRRRLRKALQYINMCNRACNPLYGHKIIPHARTQLRKQMILKGNNFLLCAENLRLKVLQLLCDEALRIGKRLSADIALRHLVTPAVANFNIVSKYLVIADLQRLYARSCAFAFLHLLQQ